MEGGRVEFSMQKKDGGEGKVYMAFIIFSVEIGGSDCVQVLCNVWRLQRQLGTQMICEQKKTRQVACLLLCSIFIFGVRYDMQRHKSRNQ